MRSLNLTFCSIFIRQTTLLWSGNPLSSVSGMDQREKVREIRLRNTAKRRGLLLRRSRRRDSLSPGFGTYGLYDSATQQVKHGDELTGYGLSLNDIEKILKGAN